MSDKLFVDSNIFLYALDKRDKKKQKFAVEYLDKISQTHPTVISTQVLNEVFVNAVRKLGIAPLSAKDFIKQLSHFETVIISTEIIEKAIDCSILCQISYWDGLMIAAAGAARCKKLITEDLNHQQIINGIEIYNPFL